ncbi:MAG: response regulator transcription factor [Chloroflexi bacterium]|nr:response regulator transcription factor [Chloroflexota bacterium]
MKILVAEDDVDLVDLMTYALQREGYTVVAAVDGQQALQRWEAEKPDLVLLDGNLPKIDGFEVCRRIRYVSSTPIIMLTARDEEEDIVRGLQIGADDYVTKPFSAKQLSARMKAVLRRSQADSLRQAAREVRVQDIVLDLQAHEVTRAGNAVQLTPLEFKILYMLAMNEGRVVPYSRLVEYAWGYYDENRSSLLKAHVTHIRKKLGLPADGSGSIRAVVGVGYSLTKAQPPAHAEAS